MSHAVKSLAFDTFFRVKCAGGAIFGIAQVEQYTALLVAPRTYIFTSLIYRYIGIVEMVLIFMAVRFLLF